MISEWASAKQTEEIERLLTAPPGWVDPLTGLPPGWTDNEDDDWAAWESAASS